MVERRRPQGWDGYSDGAANGSGRSDNGNGGGNASDRDGAPTEDSTDHYEVGYGKPPLHRRFVAGQSGNPKGRRKGSRNLKTDVRHTLALPVKVRVNNQIQTRSTQEAALRLLRDKALHGNERALEKLLELARQHNNDEPQGVSAARLAEDDQAILAAYMAKVAADASDPSTDKTTEPPEAPYPRGKRKAGP